LYCGGSDNSEDGNDGGGSVGGKEVLWQPLDIKSNNHTRQ